MRSCKSIVLLLLLTCCTLLSGCTQASQLENQAYVIVMGLDETENGQTELCALIPKISGKASAGESGGKSDDYAFISVIADNFDQALEKLNWASPRELNLAQLKLIVAGSKLAYGEKFGNLISRIAQTERLYTAANMAICQDNAKSFIQDMKPMLGTRISSDIKALFDHYRSAGYIPKDNLADLFYRTQSVYSDPMLPYAIRETSQTPEENASESQAAGAFSSDAPQVSGSVKSDFANRYLGSAVFRNGRMRGVFTGTQTIMANLIRNDLEYFRYECAGQNLEIVPVRACRSKVEVYGDQTKISIDTKLSIAAQEGKPDENVLRESLERDMRSCISAAQNFGAEPFGFAETAARSFPDLHTWVRFGWPERFKNAKIEIKLSFAYSDA